jgi:hypothetical protein
MAAPREALSDVIADLESKGSLSGDDAARLRSAPVWWISAPEVLSYLGALIAAQGLLVILGSVVEDLTPRTVSVGLTMLGVACAAGAWPLRSKGPRLERVSDFLVVLATGSLAGAIGITIALAGPSNESSVLVASGLALAAGLATLRRTRFSGTFTTVVALQVVLFAFIARFDISEYYGPLLFLASGALLLWLGTTRIGFAFGARLAGAVSATGATIAFAAIHDNLAAALVALAATVVLLAAGLRRKVLEVVVVAGFGTVAQVGMASNELFPSSPLAQGLAVTVCGLAVVIGSVTIVRRTRTAA